MACEPPPLDRDKRPFDFLNARRGKVIRLNFGREDALVGTLEAFDIHLNVWLLTPTGHKLVRGGAIKFVDDP